MPHHPTNPPKGVTPATPPPPPPKTKGGISIDLTVRTYTLTEDQMRRLWRGVKQGIIETMRRCEPDYGEEIDLKTQEILVRAVEQRFEDWIYELSPPSSKEITRAYEAPEEDKPLTPDWEKQ